MMKKAWSTALIAGASTVALATVAATADAATKANNLPTHNVSVAMAKKEGMVHGFGMPANWANLGNMWASFQKKYGIKTVYQAEGNMSSAQELQAFAKEKNHPIGDVGDIGISFGPGAVQMGVLAPYKNKYWNQIPANLKNKNGYWAAAYYGVIAFEVNAKKVKQIPTTWQDLLKPEYKGLIGMGDPRQAGESFDAVVAAAVANGGSVNNLQPGINFFAKLKKSGNWNGSNVGTSEMQTGQNAIQIVWNYLGESDQKQLKSEDIKVIVPKDGTVAGPYVEVINKYAPHPYAARLLNEYLFSNAGQISYAEGGAYPVRLKHIKLPKGVHLPPLPKKVTFLTGDLSKQQNLVNNAWQSQVLG